LPPAEATMCGTPSITGTNDAALEIFTEKGAFFIKNPCNVDEIKEQMFKALTNEKKIQEVIKYGQESLKKYTWGHYTKKVLDAWEND